MQRVKIYDTTLRDGMQAEGVSFSLKDKLAVAKKLDALGIHYIEGGWPSNPKDINFFKEIVRIPLRQAKIVAFGSTRRANKTAKDDPNLKTMLSAGTPAVAIFGKSWTLHVKKVLKTTLQRNLKMIEDSISFMKSKGKEVIYDAEHFFDGYKDNPEYALRTLKAAEKAGADWIVLCDTNGGVMPYEIESVSRKVKREMKTSLGIHTHNDSGMAVANSLMAVKAGCTQVQGTINGYGERCGNADLSVVIPNLKLKLGVSCISNEQLRTLKETSRYVSELANLIPDDRQPFVGDSAFAHKGGMHVDAVRKTPLSCEHIRPELVGNRQRVLISELSGKGNVLYKASQFGLDLSKDSPETKKMVKVLKELEHRGYQFEAAEGSFELLMRKSLRRYKKLFELEGFRVSVEKREDNRLISEATIKVKVGGVREHTAAEGDGPVNALDNALRKALEKFYPALADMHLSDFKVRILDPKSGTAAQTRVLIESRDHKDTWRTVGVSENIIEASWQALVDSIEYKLLKDKKNKQL
ncbi:citramalate synthase [candidate division NPL-UPA2 bacterium]|nr:citramalate synthase [candidate division NPL-UPA2 bacterium]